MLRATTLLLAGAAVAFGCSSDDTGAYGSSTTAATTGDGTVTSAGATSVTGGGNTGSANNTNDTNGSTAGSSTTAGDGTTSTTGDAANDTSATSTSTTSSGGGAGNTTGVSNNNGAGFTNTTGAGGGTNSGASTTGTAGGGGTSLHDIFGSCRFHFGAIDQFARNNPSIAAELDFFTPGWMGVRDTFDQGYVCDDTNPGGPLAGLVPVVVAYVAAFYAKRHNNLNDCNVGSPDLCTHGAQFIKQNLSNIMGVYSSYAQGYAQCYGTTRPIVFEMEPDYYQYTYDSQTDPMTPAEAGSIMSQFVAAIKEHLPNAVFSIDISPWVAPNNGADGGADWYSNFDMTLFTFVNTSGGSTDAASETIRGSNNMTWAGVSTASGKHVLADTGYGVNGSSAGHDTNWDNPTYINQRIADGVISISQYNPNSNWGSTIAQIRSQLDPPPGCE